MTVTGHKKENEVTFIDFSYSIFQILQKFAGFGRLIYVIFHTYP